jgi:hypothetical protein
MCADAWQHQVAFHATGLASDSPPYGTPLIFPSVKYNHGSAYNSSTGHFVAPFPGIYIFLASVGYSGHFDIVVDNTEISTGYHDYGGSGHTRAEVTAHAVTHLNISQHVWVQSNGGSYWIGTSRFSGFLLSHDF